MKKNKKIRNINPNSIITLGFDYQFLPENSIICLPSESYLQHNTHLQSSLSFEPDSKQCKR